MATNWWKSSHGRWVPDKCLAMVKGTLFLCIHIKWFYLSEFGYINEELSFNNKKVVKY